MLIRFRPDVIDLKPAVVVILAGTNNIAGNTGPMTIEETEANYASIAELARAHDIKLVFSSILPVQTTRPRRRNFSPRPREKVLALNRWLQDYCAKNGCVYLDYFSALTDQKGLLKKELAEEASTPTPAGYKIMAPLAEAAIQKALSK